MRRNTRQLVVLGALLATLAALVAYRTGGTPTTVAPVERADGQAAAPPVRAVPVTGLRLDVLTATNAEVGEVARNPFRFAPRPAPAVRRTADVPPAFVPAPPVPSGPPPPPPIPLKFIGVMDAPERVGRLAILSDSRGGVFYGKEGDTIEGRYRVIRISSDTAELAYLDGRGRQVIRLSGQ